MLGTNNRGDDYLCNRLPVIFPGILKQPFWRPGLEGPLVQFSKAVIVFSSMALFQLKKDPGLIFSKTDGKILTRFKVNISEYRYCRTNATEVSVDEEHCSLWQDDRAVYAFLPFVGFSLRGKQRDQKGEIHVYLCFPMDRYISDCH